MKFFHRTLPQSVRFGSGSSHTALAAEIEERSAGAVMIIAAASELELAQRIVGELDVRLWWDEVAPHVPIEVAERARAAARESSVDLLVSVGGGSTTGLAKAIALTDGIPIVSIPTTYAGSEATNVWGLTTAARKETGSKDVVLPATVIYDAELTLTLPVDLSVASGLNAIAHCIDSMWAPNSDPINRAMAEEGLRSVAEALPVIAEDPVNLQAREQLLYGAYASAVAFASAGSGLHHKICHVLGGAYDLPHAATHSAVLPQVLNFNVSASEEAEERIARALSASDARSGLEALYQALPSTRALSDVGYERSAIPQSVELILPIVPDSNPRSVTPGDLTEVLERAFTGASIA